MIIPAFFNEKGDFFLFLKICSKSCGFEASPDL